MGELAGLLAAFTWSCTSIVLASLATKTSPVALSALRLSAASLALPLVLIFSGSADNLLAASILTVLGVAASGILAYGLGDTIYIRTLGTLGLQVSFPLSQSLFIALTVAGGVVLLDEPFTGGLVAGAALIALGAALLIRSNTESSSAAGLLSRRDLRPYGLLVVIGAIWAAATLSLAGAKGDLTTIAVAAIRTPAGAVSMLAFGLLTRPAEIALPFRDRAHIGTIVAAGIVGTLFGSLMYVYSVVEAGAARASVLSATSPLMAFPLGIIFLRHQFRLTSAAGTGLCVLGILLVVLW